MRSRHFINLKQVLCLNISYIFLKIVYNSSTVISLFDTSSSIYNCMNRGKYKRAHLIYTVHFPAIRDLPLPKIKLNGIMH